MRIRTVERATRRGARPGWRPAAAGWILLVAAAALLPGDRARAQGAGRDAAAVGAVDELRERYISAFNAHDAAGAASHFAEDGVLLPPHDAARQGREAVRRRLRGLFEAQDVTMQTLPEEAWSAGDRVVERGLLFLEIRREGPDGAARRGGDTGKYVLVARRTGEGWKIAWLIWNQDHPPEDAGEGGAGAGTGGPGAGG